MAGLPNLWRQQKKKGAGIHIRSAVDVVTSTIFPRLVGPLFYCTPFFSHCLVARRSSSSCRRGGVGISV